MLKLKYFYAIAILLFFAGCKENVNSPVMQKSKPAIYPDYVDVTVPATIAPLNFWIKTEKYDLIDVVLKSEDQTA